MKRLIFTSCLCVLFVACPALGLVEFKDGLTHNIDYPINDSVKVDYQTPYMYTTVNVLTGLGDDYSLSGFEHSRINIYSGYTSYLYSYDSSQVNISGGSITDLHSRGSSHVVITGGAIGDLDIGFYSIVDISGGWMGCDIDSRDASQVNISGGWFGDLTPYYRSKIQIFGSDFAVDGQPFGYGELTSIIGFEPEYEPRRHLTGTLLSGEPTSNDFYIGHEARIILVPEPATIAMLGFGSLALLRRRKK
jgi:hypothetical protein